MHTNNKNRLLYLLSNLGFILISGCVVTDGGVKRINNSYSNSPSNGYVASNFSRVNKDYVDANEKKIIITPADEVINFTKLNIDYIEPRDKKEKVISKSSSEKSTTQEKKEKKPFSLFGNKEKSKDTEKDNNNSVNEKVKERESIDEAAFSKMFFAYSRDEIELMRERFAKSLPNTVRAGLFDISYPGQRKNYDDSNYFAKESFLTVTYRPKTLYGADFYNYIAYCPIFFDWEKKSNIVDYFSQFNLLEGSTINENGMSFKDLTKYLIGISFSHCVTFNEGYQNKKEILSEDKSILLADMFLITLFVIENKIEQAKFIIDNNHLLHKKDYQNKEKLNKYFLSIREKMPSYHENDYYSIWKSVYRHF